MPLTVIDEELINEIKSTRPRLASLSLRDNELVEIGAHLQALRHLSKLDVSNNKLETLVGLNLPELKELRVKGNCLRTLRGIENCTKLRVLDCRDNLLSLAGMKDIKGIRVKEIQIEGNPTVADPSDVQQLLPSVVKIDGIRVTQLVPSPNRCDPLHQFDDSNSVNDVLAELGISLSDSVQSTPVSARKTFQLDAALSRGTDSSSVRDDILSDEHQQRRNEIHHLLKYGRSTDVTSSVDGSLSSVDVSPRKAALRTHLHRRSQEGVVSTEGRELREGVIPSAEVKATSVPPTAVDSPKSFQNLLRQQPPAAVASHSTSEPALRPNSESGAAEEMPPSQNNFLGEGRNEFPSLAAFLDYDDLLAAPTEPRDTTATTTAVNEVVCLADVTDGSSSRRSAIADSQPAASNGGNDVTRTSPPMDQPMEDSNLSDILKELTPRGDPPADQNERIRAAILNPHNPPPADIDVVKHAAELQLRVESLQHFKVKSESLQLQFEELQKQHRALQSAVDTERLAHEEEIRTLRADHQNEQKQLDEQKQSEWLQLIRECREDLERATSKNDMLVKERNAQREEHSGVVEELRRQLDNEQTSVRQLTERVAELGGRNEMLADEMTSAEEVVEQLREQVDEQNAQIAALRSEKSDLLGALSNATRVGNPQAALAITSVLLDIT